MKKRRSIRRLRDEASLRRLLVFFILAVLVDAALLTVASYIVMRRTGIKPPFADSPMFFMGMSLMLTAAIGMVIGVHRLKPVHEVADAMKKVGEGDFTRRVDPARAVGEIATLVNSYNDMAEELSGIELFRTDFINNFSHEFKTPIVSIRGFARQLLRDDLSGDQRREYAEIIAREADRLANMSSNILLLTKLEHQKIITDKAPFRLDEQLRRCVLLFEKQWSEKDLDLRLDLDELSYDGSEELLQHVWVNLIGNAIKFSPEGGVLELSLMRVQDFLLIRVTDHGEGMDAETQARVFEKFYQGDSAHATEGNGLGLSLAGRIVELSGGKIALTSSPGNGATFSVYLPVEKA